MKLLLDTHIFLWTTAEPHKLPTQARAAIEDTANDVYVSAIVPWEIGIKYARRRLALPVQPSSYVSSRIAHYGFKSLSISIEHTFAASELPRIHEDPFDRMLVAQAHVERMTLISVDTTVRRYPVDILFS